MVFLQDALAASWRAGSRLSDMSGGLFCVAGEPAQLLINELSELCVFCCQLFCSASHFSYLVLGLSHGGTGLGFCLCSSLLSLRHLGAQRFLGLFCLM